MIEAEDYVLEWCDKRYGEGKDLEDWTTYEVMQFANDFSLLQSVKFAEWLVNCDYEYHHDHKIWVNWSSVLQKVTTEQLYELFKEETI